LKTIPSREIGEFEQAVRDKTHDCEVARLAVEKVVASLRAVGAKSLAQLVVAGGAVCHVFVTAGPSGELIFQKVTDRIAFEKEGLCILLARYQENPVKLVEASGNGDAGVAEHMCDLGFAEAGAIVFEREVTFGVVQLETAEAVGVSKFAKGAELVVGEGGLQFEFGFEKCHGESIAGGEAMK